MSETTTSPASADFQRRFSGVGRLYGDAALQTFQQAHVCVVGVGGVGSWVVEALARSAIGTLTLIDLDHVAVSNVNRQLQALTDDFGRPKVSVLAERCRQINPQIVVHEVEDFVTPENVEQLLHGRFSYVVDAIDQMKTKAAIIACCRSQRLPLITTGAAGGQIDPTRITLGDLAHTIQDPLLSKVRSHLRREYGFPRGEKSRFGVEAVYSTEPLRYPQRSCDSAAAGGGGLNCSGFGSAVAVTAAFGLFAAGRVLQQLGAGLQPRQRA